MVGKARPAVPIIMGNPIFWENSRKMFLVFFFQNVEAEISESPPVKKIKFFNKFLKKAYIQLSKKLLTDHR